MLKLFFCLLSGFSFGNVFMLDISPMQYYFWFKDKIHENWVIDTIDKSHMITCVKNCQKNTECTGMALGPLDDDYEDHSRPCLLLANVNETECDAEYNCTRDSYQVYLERKRPMTTTTEASTSVTMTSTTIESTTEMESTSLSSTTTKEDTTRVSTTKAHLTTTPTPTSTTTPAPTSSTTPSTLPTTATETEEPTPTTKAITQTPTTTESSSTATEAEATSSTTDAQTTSTTTEAQTTSTTTEAQTTSTTTEAETTSTTTEAETTSTTIVKTTTSTVAPSSTTKPPTTLTTEKTTTTTPSSTTESDDPEECKSPPAQIFCDEPIAQHFLFGLTSTAPLFTDANMKAKCEADTSNIFKTSSSKKAKRPFAGLFKCGDNEAITGLEVCFVGDLIYIAPFCTALESGYRLATDDIKKSSNTPENPGNAICPDKMAQLTLKLEKDDDGNIAVYITCAKIVKG